MYQQKVEKDSGKRKALWVSGVGKDFMDWVLKYTQYGKTPVTVVC